MDLGQAVRALRIKQQMTQEQLAERCGMSINAISMIELGKRIPAKATVEKVCKAFDIPVSYMLLATIEERDIPEEKRVLYRALVEPLRDELLDKTNNE